MALAITEPILNAECPLANTLHVHVTGVTNGEGYFVDVFIEQGREHGYFVRLGAGGGGSEKSGTSLGTLIALDGTLVPGEVTLRANNVDEGYNTIASADQTIVLTGAYNPSVTLDTDDADIIHGQTVNLTWSSVDCDAYVTSNFGGSGTSGTLEIEPDETIQYSITLMGLDDEEYTDTVEVTVIQPDLPETPYSPWGNAYTQDGDAGPGGDYERVKPGRATLSSHDCVILLRRSNF